LRRRVGVDSSEKRSVCSKRCDVSTRTRGRVVGGAAGVSEPSRTVMPMLARSASVVLM